MDAPLSILQLALVDGARALVPTSDDSLLVSSPSGRFCLIFGPRSASVYRVGPLFALQCVYTFSHNQGPVVYEGAVSDDGHAASFDRTTEKWLMFDSGGRLYRKIHAQSTSSLTFGSGSVVGFRFCFNYFVVEPTGQPLKVFGGELKRHVTAASFFQNLLFLTTTDGCLIKFDWRQNRVIAESAQHPLSVHQVSISANGRYGLSVSFSPPTTVIWHAETLRTIHNITQVVGRAMFLPGSNTVVCTGMTSLWLVDAEREFVTRDVANVYRAVRIACVNERTADAHV